jgi:hypothetical protein
MKCGQLEGIMQVKLDTADVKILLGRNGVTLTIADTEGKHVGHLRIGQATVEWRRGRVRPGNGHKMRLEELIGVLDKQRV